MHHDDGAKNSIKIFANIFISFIGAGILGMPHAFREVRRYFWGVSNDSIVDGSCHEHIRLKLNYLKNERELSKFFLGFLVSVGRSYRRKCDHGINWYSKVS